MKTVVNFLGPDHLIEVTDLDADWTLMQIVAPSEKGPLQLVHATCARVSLKSVDDSGWRSVDSDDLPATISPACGQVQGCQHCGKAVPDSVWMLYLLQAGLTR